MLLRAILDQVAQGRAVTFSPVPGLPELVEVAIAAGDGEVIADASCNPNDRNVSHLIHVLTAQLGETA